MVSVGNSSNGTAEDDEEEGRTARVVFLALIMLLALLLNLLLLFAFVHNKKARRSVQGVTVIQLASVCLGDCVLNMPLVLGSLTAGQDWTFGQPLCRWHSFVMSLVLVETSLLLTVLLCDRYLAVRHLDRYESLISPVRLVIVLAFTWLQSLAFSVPFFLDTVKTTFQLKLHTCSVSDETSLVFICVASVLCFLVPAVVIVVVLVLVFHTARKHQQEVKMIVTQNHYCDQVVKQEPALRKEMPSVKYVGVLCFLWFLLEIPYIVTTYIQQYRLSSELSFSVDYPWGVDVAFIWMRFSFSALFPCVTFVWRKDLWHCCKEHLLCHRSNSVLDIKVTVDPKAKTAAAKPKLVPQPVKAPPKAKDRDHPKAEVPNLLSFSVPVLFATSDGIHIETPCSEASEGEDADADLRHQQPKGRQLDITSNTADHDHLAGDTSDYDSEAECYSTQPLSTRHIRGALEANSVSTPGGGEGQGQHERGVASGTAKLTSSQGTDSGLELSGTVGSSMGKRTQQHINSAKDNNDTDSAPAATTTSTTHISSETSAAGDSDGDTLQKSSTSSNVKPVRTISVVTEADADSKVPERVDDTQPVQPSAPPPAVPKPKGRLKPLHTARLPKARTEWPEKSITMKTDVRKGDGAPHTNTTTTTTPTHTAKSSVSHRTNRGAEQVSAPGESRAGGARSSKEGRGRGHKRSVTSDSERALLSSDSSMEIQVIQVHSRADHTDGKD